MAKKKKKKKNKKKDKKKKKKRKYCDKYGTVCQHKWRFGGIDFFFLSKKSRWHSGTNRNYGLEVLVLLTNSCARGSIYGGTGWHKWRQY